LAEIETQNLVRWRGSFADQVNSAMRRLAYEMDRIALAHESKGLATFAEHHSRAFEHLAELTLPTLVIVGALDTPYILAAADYMIEKMPSAKKVVIEDAAHLPNMEHPDEFQRIVKRFLDELTA
jgi:pimeloyl-ACP methyl ester carboxylesterase